MADGVRANGFVDWVFFFNRFSIVVVEVSNQDCPSSHVHALEYNCSGCINSHGGQLLHAFDVHGQFRDSAGVGM